MSARATKAERERKRLEATAYHEAGHAVMAFYTKRTVLRVSVIPEGKFLGYVLTTEGLAAARGAPPSLRFDARHPRQIERWIDREIMIVLAGPVAERRFTGAKNVGLGIEGDHRQLMNYVSALYRPGEGVHSRFILFKLALVEQQFAEPPLWVRVEALALALLDRREMSGREARAIYEASAKDTDRIQEIYDERFLRARSV